MPTRGELMIDAMVLARHLEEVSGITASLWDSNRELVVRKAQELVFPATEVVHGKFTGAARTDLQSTKGQPHVWLEDENNIIDPLRWVFKGTSPHILIDNGKTLRHEYARADAN